MNAHALTRPCPAKIAGSKRSDEEHAAIWQAYIVEGLSAKASAERINALFGKAYSESVIISYSDRQGWTRSHVSKSGRRAKPPMLEEAPPAPGRRKLRRRPVGPSSTTIVWLGAKDCRFPVGPSPGALNMADQLFCAEVQHPAAAPYCLACARVAYSAAALQRKMEAHAAQTRSR